jgi:hypothetical protein
MKKFLAPVLLITLFAALAAGCSSSNSSTTAGLKIELTGIVRAGDGSTQVSWRVTNPNVVSYLMAQASHRIYLNGVLVGTVNDHDPLAVPAQNHADRVSPLVSAGPAADRTLVAAVAAGSAPYRVESAILVQLYGDITDKGDLVAAGTVPVSAR